MADAKESNEQVLDATASNIAADFQRSFGATSRVFSLVALAVNITLLGIVGYLTTIVRANSEKVFADCNVQLPLLTMMLLDIPTIACVVGIGLIGCLLGWVEYAICNQGSRLSLHIMMAVLMLVFTATYCLSLLMPMVEMMHNMQ
jgi:hypothetical protein